jgi:hypothetical protein
MVVESLIIQPFHCNHLNTQILCPFFFYLVISFRYFTRSGTSLILPDRSVLSSFSITFSRFTSCNSLTNFKLFLVISERSLEYMYHRYKVILRDHYNTLCYPTSIYLLYPIHLLLNCCRHVVCV